MKTTIKNFKLWEKMLLKNWDEYAKIISAKYDALPTFDQDAVQYWKALNDSNYILWKRLLSRVNVIFVSGEEEYRDTPQTISILDKEHQLIFWEGGQPYDTQSQMKADYDQNGRLYISIDYSEHPVFNMIDNIVFRTVHDFIVHIQGDYPFGLKGELQAFNLHAKLAPKNALPALYTEVVGQVCQFIIKGDFPIQKVAVMDDVDYYNIGSVDGIEIKDKELNVVKRFNDFE
jgi:hypothetical protein